MNETKDFDKPDDIDISNDVNANTLAMLALVNNTEFTANSMGMNAIIPPPIIINANDDDEKDLTK